MSQASFLSDPPEPSLRRVAVLAAVPVGRAYDYTVPEGMTLSPGDIVRVPFGGRTVTGVVWDRDDTEGEDKKIRLKPVAEKYAVSPLRPVHRRFVEWVAGYTLSDLGSVLRFMLSPSEVLSLERAEVLYHAAPPGVIEKRLSLPRRRVLAALAEGRALAPAALKAAAGASPTLLRTMVADGLVLREESAPAAPAARLDPDFAQVDFSPAQAQAAADLRCLVAGGGFQPVLLDGVTGSGKTEVYFDAVAEAIAQGRQVLILLPEISLSAQFTRRFAARFGAPPAVWHSEVTPAQKRRVWQGVAAGRTQVVVGARSALFLPFSDLGLIVVDEEHDQSYKQEDGVLYHARDMAVVRARLEACPVVLVSATPALETVMNARQGKYHVLTLPERHAGAALPTAEVIDMRREKISAQKFLSKPLLETLRGTLAAGDQALLFLNRRGYAPLTLCRACGYRFECPSCSAWLVEHRRQGVLQCHHCGYRRPMPHACPSCEGVESLAACGPGVERIHEEVAAELPEARILVLASDLVGGAAAMQAAVEAVESRSVDIVIGTQMIAKGHHFPGLTLVGVIDADLGLAGGDLRAGERSFQVLHQVAGRAGRGQKAGRVLFQTVMPEHGVIRALAAHDRDAFLAAEAQERSRAAMPPFGRLAGLVVSGADEQAVLKTCRSMAQQAPAGEGIRLLGPAPAPLSFLRGRHRQRFLVKATGSAARGLVLQDWLRGWLALCRVPRGVDVKVDIDPQNFL